MFPEPVPRQAPEITGDLDLLLSYMRSAKTGVNPFEGGNVEPLKQRLFSIVAFFAEAEAASNAEAEARVLKADEKARLSAAGKSAAQVIEAMAEIDLTVARRVLAAGVAATDSERKVLELLSDEGQMHRVMKAIEKMLAFRRGE